MNPQSGQHTADMNLLKSSATVQQTSEIFNAPPPDFIPVEMDVYTPTRLDYFAARALQGLVAGRSEKDRRKAARDAVSLAKEIVELLNEG